MMNVSTLLLILVSMDLAIAAIGNWEGCGGRLERALDALRRDQSTRRTRLEDDDPETGIIYQKELRSAPVEMTVSQISVKVGTNPLFDPLLRYKLLGSSASPGLERPRRHLGPSGTLRLRAEQQFPPDASGIQRPDGIRSSVSPTVGLSRSHTIRVVQDDAASETRRYRLLHQSDSPR